MTAELEDKYERFFRYFDIDIKAIEESATGGSLSDYYTKTESDTITNALDTRVTALETGGSVDLTNYYTKGETNGLLAGKQSTNAILTNFTGLAPANNDLLQYKAGVWTNRTPIQLKQDLSLDNVNNTSDASKPISTATQTALDSLDSRVTTLEGSSGPDLTNYYTKTETDTALATKQAADSDLTAIAGLVPTDNDIIQRIAGAWVNRTPSQLKTSLALAAADVGLGNVDNTSDASKPISTATQTALDLKAALTVTSALDTRITALETPTVSTLSYSATVTPDASVAKNFKLTMTGDAALAIPTNGATGNRLFLEITASGADRTLTLNGSYRLTTGTSATIVIPNSKSQFIGLRYNGTSWYVIASTQEL